MRLEETGRDCRRLDEIGGDWMRLEETRGDWETGRDRKRPRRLEETVGDAMLC